MARGDRKDLKPGIGCGFGGRVLSDRLYAIDVSTMPDRIAGSTIVTRDGKPAEKLDLDGLATDGIDDASGETLFFDVGKLRDGWKAVDRSGARCLSSCGFRPLGEALSQSP